MTRPYAEVIGDPIAHSKSPLIHKFWLAKLGIEADYRARHVRPDELADYFTQRREDAEWRGCNVTIPHKEAVGDYLDRLDDRATAIGAVNTVFRASDGRLVGTNTDIDGVADAIGPGDRQGEDICVIGAGGAARAAFTLLAEKRWDALLVLARNPGKAVRVSAQCGARGTGVPFKPNSTAFCEASLLINATQLGMAGQESMPAFVLEELAELANGALVFDMVYVPLETELLATARRLGFRTADGLVMLIGQAAAAFATFFGQSAPREHDAELRGLLTQ
jgi:shikimate dehydrogenase